MNPLGYQARVVEEFFTGGHRLHIWRRRPDGQVDTLREDGTWTTVDPSIVVPDTAGLRLPAGAWQAICEHATPPGPSAGEVARLEEALAVERSRVDRTLAAFLPAAEEADRG